MGSGNAECGKNKEDRVLNWDFGMWNGRKQNAEVGMRSGRKQNAEVGMRNAERKNGQPAIPVPYALTLMP